MAVGQRGERRRRLGDQVDDAREAVDRSETHVERLDGGRDLGQRLAHAVVASAAAGMNGKRRVTWAGTPTFAAKSS